MPLIKHFTNTNDKKDKVDKDYLSQKWLHHILMKLMTIMAVIVPSDDTGTTDETDFLKTVITLMMHMSPIPRLVKNGSDNTGNTNNTDDNNGTKTLMITPSNYIYKTVDTDYRGKIGVHNIFMNYK